MHIYTQKNTNLKSSIIFIVIVNLNPSHHHAKHSRPRPKRSAFHHKQVSTTMAVPWEQVLKQISQHRPVAHCPRFDDDQDSFLSQSISNGIRRARSQRNMCADSFFPIFELRQPLGRNQNVTCEAEFANNPRRRLNMAFFVLR